MVRTIHMQIAKNKKDDEFYTRYEDIENKLKWYFSEFKNKIIYMPCDGIGSNFWKYFLENYQKIKYKKIITTSIDSKTRVDYDGSSISILNIDSGDFRDNEQIFRECDTVVTNPPFSLARPFYEMVKKTGCDYFFIGNILSISAWPEDILTFKMYVSTLHNVKKFERPEGGHKTVPTFWYHSYKPSKTEIEYVENEVLVIKKYFGTEIWKIKRWNDIKRFDNKKGFFTIPITSIADFYFSPFFGKIEFYGILRKLDKAVILADDSEFYYIGKDKNKKRITETKEVLYEISDDVLCDSNYFIDEKTNKRYRRSFDTLLCKFKETQEIE